LFMTYDGSLPKQRAGRVYVWRLSIQSCPSDMRPPIELVPAGEAFLRVGRLTATVLLARRCLDSAKHGTTTRAAHFRLYAAERTCGTGRRRIRAGGAREWRRRVCLLLSQYTENALLKPIYGSRQLAITSFLAGLCEPLGSCFPPYSLGEAFRRRSRPVSFRGRSRDPSSGLVACDLLEKPPCGIMSLSTLTPICKPNLCGAHRRVVRER
jgi:hypothetical protein